MFQFRIQGFPCSMGIFGIEQLWHRVLQRIKKQVCVAERPWTF